LGYANVNLLADNIDTKRRNNENAKAGLQLYTEKTKYMLLSHHQNAGQNHDIRIANRFFENVVDFRHLRMIVTN
jgi:hypothetical protein